MTHPFLSASWRVEYLVLKNDSGKKNIDGKINTIGTIFLLNIYINIDMKNKDLTGEITRLELADKKELRYSIQFFTNFAT